MDYERERAMQSLIILIITLGMLSFMPILLNRLSDSISTETSNDSMVIETTSSEIIESSAITTVISSELSEQIETSELIEYSESILNSTYGTMEELMEQMISIIKIPLMLLIPIMILRFTMSIVGFGQVSISDFVDNDYDSFSSFLSKRKEQEISDKLIYNTILKSNKKINNIDMEFLQNCIETKTEWYSFKKQIIEVNQNEKLFSVLLLDILANLDVIKKYFESEENKSEGIKDTYNTNFEEYIKNEDNYFHIKNSYYLKELVFYVLTNNVIKVKELYNLISKSTRRADISCIIANFVESELSLGNDMSTTKTLEEAVEVFNHTYDLDLNIGVAKNLIFLSKINNDQKLQEEIIEKTTLLEEMKQYKHYLYS